MQLRFNKTIRKNIVIVDLEAIKLTECEIEALRRFDAPVISVEKMYPLNADNPSFPVKFQKKLRQSFRIRVKFDGTNDIEGACEAAESFYDDIRDIIEDTLYELTDKLEDSFTHDLGRGVEIIRSGSESLPPDQRPDGSGCCPPPFKPGNHVTVPVPPKPNGNRPCPPPAPPRPIPPCNCDDTSVIWTDGDSVHI